MATNLSATDLKALRTAVANYIEELEKDQADWAMVDGVRAFLRGASRGENPFDLGDYSLLAWDDGWMAANKIASQIALLE